MIPKIDLDAQDKANTNGQSDYRQQACSHANILHLIGTG